jgi:hypothetical protein
MHINSITLCNHNITLHIHNITPLSITMYLSTTPRKEIDMDTEVEDEVKEDLEEE